MQPKINKKTVKADGVKFFVEKDGKEVARAFLYIMNNDLHKEPFDSAQGRPFGLLEDLFVDETLRGQGIGTELLNMVIAEAKKLNCYKLVATSRYEREGVHKMYEKAGFKNFGIEFKMYFHE
jgi:GNAT superfamily N-acetyltransferase